ncbi:MAG: hypothetical protein HRT35_08965 [Algicola sp.]|nr:hypothetical protein [Algicola sp.]
MTKNALLAILMPFLVACTFMVSQDDQQYSWLYKGYDKKQCEIAERLERDQGLIKRLQETTIMDDSFLDRRQIYYNRTMVCDATQTRLLIFTIGGEYDVEAVIKVGSDDKIIDTFFLSFWGVNNAKKKGVINGTVNCFIVSCATKPAVIKPTAMQDWTYNGLEWGRLELTGGRPRITVRNYNSMVLAYAKKPINQQSSRVYLKGIFLNEEDNSRYFIFKIDVLEDSLAVFVIDSKNNLVDNYLVKKKGSPPMKVLSSFEKWEAK